MRFGFWTVQYGCDHRKGRGPDWTVYLHLHLSNDGKCEARLQAEAKELAALQEPHDSQLQSIMRRAPGIGSMFG